MPYYLLAEEEDCGWVCFGPVDAFDSEMAAAVDALGYRSLAWVELSHLLVVGAEMRFRTLDQLVTECYRQRVKVFYAWKHSVKLTETACQNRVAAIDAFTRKHDSGLDSQGYPDGDECPSCGETRPACAASNCTGTTGGDYGNPR